MSTTDLSKLMSSFTSCEALLGKPLPHAVSKKPSEPLAPKQKLTKQTPEQFVQSLTDTEVIYFLYLAKSSIFNWCKKDSVTFKSKYRAIYRYYPIGTFSSKQPTVIALTTYYPKSKNWTYNAELRQAISKHIPIDQNRAELITLTLRSSSFVSLLQYSEIKYQRAILEAIYAAAPEKVMELFRTANINETSKNIDQQVKDYEQSIKYKRTFNFSSQELCDLRKYAINIINSDVADLIKERLGLDKANVNFNVVPDQEQIDGLYQDSITKDLSGTTLFNELSKYDIDKILTKFHSLKVASYYGGKMVPYVPALRFAIIFGSASDRAVGFTSNVDSIRDASELANTVSIKEAVEFVESLKIEHPDVVNLIRQVDKLY